MHQLRVPSRLTAERVRVEIANALGVDVPCDGEELRALVAHEIEDHARRHDIAVTESYGRTSLMLLFVALLHEERSLPGDTIRMTPGRRLAIVTSGTSARGRRRAPSHRLASTMLRVLVDAFERHDVLHPSTVAALYLLHEGLDVSRVFVTPRSARPPKGGARVSWLARKVRDMTREPRGAGT